MINLFMRIKITMIDLFSNYELTRKECYFVLTTYLFTFIGMYSMFILFILKIFRLITFSIIIPLIIFSIIVICPLLLLILYFWFKQNYIKQNK